MSNINWKIKQMDDTNGYHEVGLLFLITVFDYLLRTIKLPMEYPAPKEQITPMSPVARFWL